MPQTNKTKAKYYKRHKEQKEYESKKRITK